MSIRLRVVPNPLDLRLHLTIQRSSTNRLMKKSASLQRSVFSTFGGKERASGRNTLTRLVRAHTTFIPPTVEPS
jgi:hypothetical protein